MSEQQTFPTTFQIWSQAIEIIVKNRESYLKVLALSFLLPYIILNTFLSQLSGSLGQNLANLSKANIEQMLESINPFFSIYFLSSLLLLTFFIWGFMVATSIAINSVAQKNKNLKEIYAETAKKIFPQGFLIFAFIAFLSIEKIFFSIVPYLNIHIFSMFGLMAYVILLQEEFGSVKSLKRALFFKYCDPKKGSGFNTAMVLIGLSTLVFGWEYVSYHLYQYILKLDVLLGLKRDLWVLNLGLYFSNPIYILARLFYGTMGGIAIIFVANYLVSLYFQIKPKMEYLV